MCPFQYIQIYKYFHGISRTILGENFKVDEAISHDLRALDELYAINLNTVRYDTETISLLSTKVWVLVVQNIKDSSSFPCLKMVYGIRKWKPNCPCRLCKTVLQNLDLI